MLIAIGLREAARIPALAVEKKARSAARERIIIPVLPIITPAPSLIGVSVYCLEPGNNKPSPKTPTVTKITST